MPPPRLSEGEARPREAPAWLLGTWPEGDTAEVWVPPSSSGSFPASSSTFSPQRQGTSPHLPPSLPGWVGGALRTG